MQLTLRVLVVLLLLGGSAVAEEGSPVDYTRIWALAPDDGPGMARFVRRCVVEAGSLRFALGDCPWSQRPVWRAAATSVLLELTRDPGPERRTAALELLGDVHRWNDEPPDAVMDALVAGLGDDDDNVRATAAVTIRFLGTAAVRSHARRLIRLALEMKDLSWEQLKLAESMAAHGVVESAALLLRILKQSSHGFFRRMAIESLGLLGRRIEESIRGPLLHALRKDGAFDVRRAAARALALLGRPADIQVLLDVARTENAGYLSWIVPLDLADTSPDVGLSVRTTLDRLKHGDGDVRAATLELLGARRVADPTAINAIKQALLDADMGVRKAARDALLNHAEVVTDDDIARWLNGHTAEARWLGVTLAIARPQGDARWARMLPRTSARVRADFNSDPVLQFAADRGPAASYLAPELRRIDGPTGSWLLRGPPPPLAKIARAAVLPEGRLLERVRSSVRMALAPFWSDYDIRGAALFARMPKARAMSFRKLLVRKLKQHPWPTATRARWALAVMALDDEAASLGQAALEGVLASQSPLNGLRALAGAPDYVPRVADALAGLVTHPDPDVRKLVAKLLRRYAPEAESALAALREDPLPAVRLAAARTVLWLK